LKLFSVAVTKVSCFAGQVSVVAARYGSIVIAISVVTANCLLKVSCSSQLQMCALIQSYSFPSRRNEKQAEIGKNFDINLVLIMRT